MKNQGGESHLRDLLNSHIYKFGLRDHLPKFLFVGFLGIGVDVVSFLLITRFILSDILTAQVFSFVVAVTHNFTLNKLWTFEDKARKETKIQYLKFFVVALYALGLRSGVIAFCLRCGLPPLLSLLIGIGSGTAVNFIGSREWAFAQNNTLRPRAAETSGFLLWAFIVFLFLARLVYSSIMDLAPEEAYYWNYSIHPALSYFDHPPMVAWVISVGTFILRNTEIGVRIVGILLTMGSTWLIYSLGKMWFDKKSGLWAAFLFQAVPIYFIYGFTTTPDVPLMFFWLMTMYWVSLGLLRTKTWEWYAAGVTLGCALLSKYTAVFLVPCTFLFLLWNPDYRKWLLKKEPYLAMILSLLVLTPVIVWNYQHDWASFSFQFSRRLSKTTSHPLVYFLRFAGSQAGVAFPTFFLGLALALVITLRKSFKSPDPKWKWILSYAFPLLAFLLFYSTKSEVKVNWTLPAYLPLFIALYPCYRWLGRNAKGMTRRFVKRATSLSILVLPLIYLSVLYHIGIGIPSVPNLSKLGGWRELGAAVKKEAAAMERETGKDPFLTGMSKYHLAAELAFYAGDPHDTFSSNVFGGPGLGFEYWTDKKALQDRDALILSKGPPNIEFLKNFFTRVDDKVRPVMVTRQGRIMHTFYLVRCYGYRG